MNEADKFTVTIITMDTEQVIPVKDLATAKRLRDAVYASSDATAIVTVIKPCRWCGKHSESGGWHDKCNEEYNMRSI